MTNDEQYVPSEDLVIEAWKRYSGAQDAKYARLSDGDAGDEARRFLARVRRDAWDEGEEVGYVHGQHDAHRFDPGPDYHETTNPYRETRR